MARLCHFWLRIHPGSGFFGIYPCYEIRFEKIFGYRQSMKCFGSQPSYEIFGINPSYDFFFGIYLEIHIGFENSRKSP